MSDLEKNIEGRGPTALRANPLAPASGEYVGGAAMMTTPPAAKLQSYRLALPHADGASAQAGEGVAHVAHAGPPAASAGREARQAEDLAGISAAMSRPGSRTTRDPLMLRAATPRPRGGWRALAYDVTSGRWNPGPSPGELQERRREARIAAPLQRRHVTAFFCLKGGVGKTSTTAATSMALANLRPDPVFAIDANPDAGDLAERLVGTACTGITNLAKEVDAVRSLEDLSRFTVTSGRLTVLPGDPNPVLGDSLGAGDFERILDVVGTYYSLVQVDCGTGVTHPLMGGVLAHAGTVVIPATWSITGARRAAETVDWLHGNGFAHLAASCIVVLTAKDVVSRRVDRDAVLHHLGTSADLVVVPPDPHVADGARLDWEHLAKPTREAYLEIAAALADRFQR